MDTATVTSVILMGKLQITAPCPQLLQRLLAQSKLNIKRVVFTGKKKPKMIHLAPW